MDATYFLRQLDIADPSQFKDKPVTVIGAGGIGAAIVIALAKTGFENITVYDFDDVEEHNIPNQLLPMWVGDQETLGWKKTTALFHLVHDLADISITPVHERYTDRPLGEIVISAVDSMDARAQSELRPSRVWIPSSSWTGVWRSPRWTYTPSIC